MKIPVAPKLGKKGKIFWKKVLNEYDINFSHDLERLKMACQCLDNLEQAEKQIKKDGMYITNRYGNVTEHPALKTVKDLRLLFIKIIRELGLDLESAPDRPPSRY